MPPAMAWSKCVIDSQWKVVIRTQKDVLRPAVPEEGSPGGPDVMHCRDHRHDAQEHPRLALAG